MDECKEKALKAENRVMGFFARTYGSLGEAVREKYGEEGANLTYDAYRQSVKQACVPDWKKMKRNDAEAYANWLFMDLMEDYDFEYVEKSPESVRVRIKSCPLAKHFMSNGFGEFGKIFCDVDYDMIKDFNEATGANLVFERDKILMGGDDYCNHHIFVKK